MHCIKIHLLNSSIIYGTMIVRDQTIALDQSINQSVRQSIDQLFNQSINQSYQSISQSYQSISQSINQDKKSGMKKSI